KMDGCAAIYPALAAIFVANFYGMPLGVTDYLLIVLVSVLGSSATAGMTGATVMLTLTLSTLGLPLEGVGLLLAIDPILDMGRTALNVTGQSLVGVIVAKREKILDQDAYDAARRTSFQAIQAEEAQDAAAEATEQSLAAAESAEREKQPATAGGSRGGPRSRVPPRDPRSGAVRRRRPAPPGRGGCEVRSASGPGSWPGGGVPLPWRRPSARHPGPSLQCIYLGSVRAVQGGTPRPGGSMSTTRTDTVPQSAPTLRRAAGTVYLPIRPEERRVR